jgi:Lon protease-like protein
MSDDRQALDAFDGVTRLFPLPNLVFFPHVVQGLHVFEPRYRQLMADALAGDKLFSLVLLKSGADADDDGPPAIEDVACLGRITEFEKLPDGRYNLRLRGLARARIVEELPSKKLYRTAKVELLPDLAPPDLESLKALRKKLTDVVLSRFDPTGQAHGQLKDLFAGEMPLGEVCDVLSYALPVPLELKQHLLADPGVEQRVEMLYHALTPKPVPANRVFPPQFSPN